MVGDGSNHMRRGIYRPAMKQLIIREILHNGVGLSCVDRDILRTELKIRICVILGNFRFPSDQKK